MCSNKVGVTYRDAGVDIDAGNKAVELMKDAVQRTYTPGVVGDIGVEIWRNTDGEGSHLA